MAKAIEVEMGPVKSAMRRKKKRMYWKRNKNSVSICYKWKREYDWYLRAYHGVPYWACYYRKEIDAVAKKIPEVKVFFENSDPGDWMTLDYDTEKKKWIPTRRIV